MGVQIRISGEQIGAHIDQWCEIIADDGEHPIVVRSLANPTTIWEIYLDWITAVRLSDATVARINILNVTRNRQRR
jgi:hypothetical protein